jgi:hypothetical protein
MTGEGQQQCNRDRPTASQRGQEPLNTEFEEAALSRPVCQATRSVDVDVGYLVRTAVRNRVRELVRAIWLLVITICK